VGVDTRPSPPGVGEPLALAVGDGLELLDGLLLGLLLGDALALWLGLADALGLALLLLGLADGLPLVPPPGPVRLKSSA
jgi:hypothetical protein